MLFRNTLYLLAFTSSVPYSRAENAGPCPLLGPDVPPPFSPSASNNVARAKQDLAALIQAALQGATKDVQLDPNNTSFSIDVYSLHEKESLFTYHYSAPALADPKEGVAEVNSDTIYRIASVSKLFTVYTYLVAVGDTSLSSPVTNYVPELADYAAKHAEDLQTNDIDYVDWRSITIGALASQMSGVFRDVAPGPAADAKLSHRGLPIVPPVNASYCGDALQIPCNRAAFFSSYFSQQPVTLSHRTPIYSNSGFQILAYALENITSQSFQSLLNTHLLDSLNVTSTFCSMPQSSRNSVVPVNASTSWYDADLRDESPAGSIYSSINDLRKLGISILNSTLLPPTQTRRWMKPVSFTSDPNWAVGAPWEITRVPTTDNRAVWAYTKSGQIGLYRSLVVLLPEWNVGYTVLGAGTGCTNSVNNLGRVVAAIITPALEQAAKNEAKEIFAGSYSTKDMTASIQSSITIEVGDDRKPGLEVTRWEYNGMDAFALITALVGADPGDRDKVSIRLYPMGLNSYNGADGIKKSGFRALYGVSDPDAPGADDCTSWMAVDALEYGAIGVDNFLFGIGKDEIATSIEPRALRSILYREDPHERLIDQEKTA
ncbi:MAG: hypothetical protein M1837_003051 [Sclerophora amabilis]|nr:MAG: hypothetical protein M1837_003051 [Sclerophora amabilis]